MYHAKARYAIQIFLGAVLLYATLYFFSGLKEFAEAFAWGKVPHSLTVLVAVCIPGFGLTLAARNFKPESLTVPVFWGIFLLALLLLALQVYINITPSLSSCKCVTLADSLMNVQDWTRTLLAAAVLLCCLAGGFAYRIQQFQGKK